MTKPDDLASLAKVTAERDAAYTVIDAIRGHLNDAAIEHSGYGLRTMGQADRVKLLVERDRQHLQQTIRANIERHVVETERDQLLVKSAAILTSARQHKSALKQLQAKVKEAIAAGNLDLLKDVL